MRSLLLFPTILSLGLATSACQRPAEPPAPHATPAAPAAAVAEVQANALRAQWRCGDELVQADAEPAGERLVLQVRGSILDMHRSEAGADTGARYVDALGNTFWQHQPDQATLTLAGLGDTLKCVQHDSGVTG